tara:strand:+ start:299 stop:457 length:159 start_codon:yes stop_codon:yes gene_type:complete
MDKNELRQLIESEQITLSDVIDIVIEINSLIGVGLISLGDDVREYIYNKISE